MEEREGQGGAGCAACGAGVHTAGVMCCDKGHSAFGVQPEPPGHGE